MHRTDITFQFISYVGLNFVLKFYRIFFPFATKIEAMSTEFLNYVDFANHHKCVGYLCPRRAIPSPRTAP